MCNEHVPTAKAKMCSELYGNIKKWTEMIHSSVRSRSQRVTICNTKWIKFILHSQRVFSVEGPFPVANQDVKIWRTHVACSLVVLSPRLQSKIIGLSEP
jgi:hypothetical protein